jgi:hypothetical protein
MVWRPRNCIDVGFVRLYGVYYQKWAKYNLTVWQVISSVIAAWTDVSQTSTPSTSGFDTVTSVVATLNIGYIWMFANCLTSATYVSTFNCNWEKRRMMLISRLTGLGHAQAN